MNILSVLLEITPDLATRDIGTPLSSPKGTMWSLFDPTPSDCGPHDTQYCMENPEQAFVEYAFSRIDEAGDEAKEERNVKSSVTENKDHKMTVESEEEFEEETDEETEEEEEEDNPKHFDTFPTMKELGYHEWLLKNP
ncbi:hypothetical protein Tco_1041962 [Tanacetum coccineum]|uniref:Uncharacterized protein n=1 Tax=Tanacetum coccineum TaxID=301880 RepID=A0ABQ5GJW8_9ASTR